MNAPADLNPLLRRIVPPVAAIGAIALFVNLGLWQLDRAAEKESLLAMFEDDSPSTSLRDVTDPPPYTKIDLEGRFLPDRQVLIDNIVKDGRLGYYVITPVEYSRSGALLLVNRGFIERERLDEDADLLTVADERTLIRGRAGHLPRVGVRGGPAFAGAGDEWPKVAVYPVSEEMADELGREVLPWVLLLDPEDNRGFHRDWRPQVSGPMTHYGYAFQWFAMAVAVLAIAGWQIRQRRRA